jgi:hypothetical protein
MLENISYHFSRIQLGSKLEDENFHNGRRVDLSQAAGRKSMK